MEAELERGDHAEVAAAASQCPEQVGVLVLGRPQQLAVGRDEVDGEEVVDREAVLAHQPADATAEGETGDAGVAHDAAGGGQTVHLRLVVDVAPERATLHPGPAVGGVDADAPHGREVDDDPVVANGGACHVVASAAYGDLQVVVAGETHSRNHVGGPDASGDQARAPVDGTVPDCTGNVVVGVIGTNQLASEPVDLDDSWLLVRVANFRGRGVVIVSSFLAENIEPPRTAAE